jgi:hypothetical protein
MLKMYHNNVFLYYWPGDQDSPGEVVPEMIQPAWPVSSLKSKIMPAFTLQMNYHLHVYRSVWFQWASSFIQFERRQLKIPNMIIMGIKTQKKSNSNCITVCFTSLRNCYSNSKFAHFQIFILTSRDKIFGVSLYHSVAEI